MAGFFLPFGFKYKNAMKCRSHILSVLVLLLSLLFFIPPASAQDLTVMTYNIRYDNPGDGENRWDERKEILVQLLDYYHPDLFGIQEGLIHQVRYIDSCLTDYRYIGVGRDDGLEKGEFSAIFIDTTRLAIQKEETFWLSETPDQISVGWDASMERICTNGLLEDRETHQSFWIFNTHFDHRGPLARLNSAKLIAQRIEALGPSDTPVILMGDLNTEPGSEPIQVLSKYLQDAARFAQKPLYGPSGTFNGFNPEALMDRRIDYIFVRGFSVLSCRHIDDRRPNNLHISDHLPVFITCHHLSSPIITHE